MKDPITLKTRFSLTPAGLAALNAAPAARRPSRKRCLVIGMSAKPARCIHPVSTPTKGQ